MKKNIRKKKRPTIAILYHNLSQDKKNTYFSSDHLLVDQQTDDIVKYTHKLFHKNGYGVQMLGISPDDLSNFQKLKADYVYNLVDSKEMELRIAKILDRLHIPHSGSSYEGIRISNNKLKTKSLFLKANLPTPKFSVIRVGDRITRGLVPAKFPVIVKPAFEHCSIGITDNSIAATYTQFKDIVSSLRKKHKQPLIAEEFIRGKEYQVTVLEMGKITVTLPIAEIAFKGKMKTKWNIYGFDEKWSKKTEVYKRCHFISPPKHLAPSIDEQIKKDSIRAFYALGLRDYARFDLRYNPAQKQWYFLEGNANAGLDPDPRDAMTASIAAMGMNLDEFVLQIVRNSLGDR